jgi:SPP1 gp7 family putative phage head morphogenesis protein
MAFTLPDAAIIAEPVEPEAAMNFWAGKSALPFAEAEKLGQGAAGRAFYVAGLSERDQVQAVKEALAEALAQGTTLREFKKQIKEVMEAQGWNGSRVENIFRTNMQSAYMAGRWAKIQEVKDQRPYLQYLIAGDDRTRPGHAVLANLVFHVDHEFWRENYPPNGYRCRCKVITLSARQVERQGLTIQEVMPGDMIYSDPATGMEYHVARPGADPGFRNNPGADWLAGLDLKKYPDLTADSYAEQRLRPQAVRNQAELAQGIQERCGGLVKNSDGIKSVKFTREKSLMSTDSHGNLFISQRNFPTFQGGFIPGSALKSAWNKLAKGEKPDWLEEYSLESLWHELTHNRQLYAPTDSSSLARRTLETLTQWSARRTYPKFMAALGGQAAHQESIKAKGLGYGPWVRNFDALLSALGVNESALLPKALNIMETRLMDDYTGPLVDALHEMSGKDKEKLEQALRWTHVGEMFERALGDLALE